MPRRSPLRTPKPPTTRQKAPTAHPKRNVPRPLEFAAPSTLAGVLSGTGNAGRGPLLLTSGKQDHTVPDAVTRSTLKQYRHSTAVTELRQFEGRGHSLTIDSGWNEIAEAVLAWLHEQGL